MEIGCGAGLGLPVLKRYAKNAVGGEYSAENIELLKKAGNDICPLLRLDAHKLPFGESSFDCVVAMAMVYYLDLPAFVAEVKRVLKPGGVLFFDSSNKDMPGFWPSPYIRRYYSVPELADLLEGIGYEVSFYGAFAEAQGLFLRHVKAFIKDTIKRLVCLLPGGAHSGNACALRRRSICCRCRIALKMLIVRVLTLKSWSRKKLIVNTA